MNLRPQLFTNFLKRHHPVIFTVVALLILSGIILSLYLVIDQTLHQDTQPEADISSNFDEKTIENIRQLQTSKDAKSTLELPSSRSNPFTE